MLFETEFLFFKNLDSEAKCEIPDVDDVDALILTKYPVYLVSPQTMDKCIPSELKRGIDPDCFKRHLSGFIEELRGVRERVLKGDAKPLCLIGRLGALMASSTYVSVGNTFAKKFEKTVHTCYKEYENIAMGAFLPNGCEKVGVKGPAILITPERIEKIAEEFVNEYRLSKGYVCGSIFKSVLAHELGHAYIYAYMGPQVAGNYMKNIGFRTLEETFAQLYAYVRSNKTIMALMNRKQSAEYKAWYVLSDAPEANMRRILELYALASSPHVSVKDIELCADLLLHCYTKDGFGDCYRFNSYCRALVPFLSNLPPWLLDYVASFLLYMKLVKRGVEELLELNGELLLIRGSLIEPMPRLSI